MTKKDLVKESYVEALFSLCDEKKLNHITVNDVINRAGTARQTFYNRFQDINELILYVSVRMWEGPLIEEGQTQREMLARALGYVIEHRTFYCQLPYHTTQNNFRESYVAWNIEYNCGRSSIDLSDKKNLQERLEVIMFSAGSTDLFLEWCKTGMKWTSEMLIDVIFAYSPSFLAR